MKMQLNRVFNNSLLALLVLALTACGFHLRGSFVVPEQYRNLQLQGQSGSAMAQVLRNSLTNAGVKLDKSAPYTLRLLDENESRRTASTAEDGLTFEYELVLNLSYQLEATSGDVLVGPAQINLERSYVHDRNNLVGSGEEANLLRKEMRQEAVAQMMRRLQAL